MDGKWRLDGGGWNWSRQHNPSLVVTFRGQMPLNKTITSDSTQFRIIFAIVLEDDELYRASAESISRSRKLLRELRKDFS